MLRTPKQDEQVAIYETRKTRDSGAHTVVIDKRPEGEKYEIACLTHDVHLARDVRLSAEAETHKPSTWCAACKAVVEAKNAPEVPQNAREWSIEMVLETIGNATSEKTCIRKVEAKIAA